MSIYFDYAATTPVNKKVFEKMKPYFSSHFGNPMALHSFGQDARKAIEESRAIAADFFEVLHEEIIFTSGATESNNLAVKGVLRGISNSQSSISNCSLLPHIITTAYEHHCLLDSVKGLVKAGEAEATFLKPEQDGVLDPKKVKEAIKENTVLVSVMFVNNEIGTTNPLSEIGEIVKKEDLRRREKAGVAKKTPLPIYFHSDITQGVHYLDFSAKKMQVDLFSLSAHKIYGPKGVGILGIKKGVKIKRQQDGGAQEFSLRAGTHNVPGIVGLGEAIQKMENRKQKKENTKKVKSLRDYFWKRLQKEVKNISLNGSMEKRVANNLNVSFHGVEGESLLMLLDMEGIACSTGSACGSESLEASHVLLSIGLEHLDAHSSLRFTLGEGNTKEEIDYATLVIKKSVEKLRKIAGRRM